MSVTAATLAVVQVSRVVRILELTLLLDRAGGALPQVRERAVVPARAHGLASRRPAGLGFARAARAGPVGGLAR